MGATGEVQPHFGPDGQVLFRLTDGNAFYLGKMGRDGSGRTKIIPSPILDTFGMPFASMFATTIADAHTPH